MKMVRRVDIARTILTLCALGVPHLASAQVPSGTQFGGRVEVITSRASTVHAGVSANTTAGLYLRLEGTVAGGPAWHEGSTYAAFRADGVARFLLDPFREARHAVYGLGGVSLMYDGLEDWRPRLLAGLGIEGRARQGRVVALELSLGGGARAALVVRRARRFGR
jgi:hypothetical protein